MSENIKPLGNRVLIKRKKPKEVLGKIFLPDSAKEKPKEGEVLAVGEGKYNKEGKLIPISAKVGDHILFSSYAGTPISTKNSDEELLVMTEEDILAIIES